MVEHGYLVLADISGYTSYLAQVELEHAHEILSDLLAVIVDQFRSMLTISKLEGDAVFATIPEAQLHRPEALLELVESTYQAFRQRRDSSQRRTTCTCRACQSIPTLDLKFFIHHGDYIIQDVTDIRELVGTDVNLIHRLMKNHVSETTGWKAYLLLTRSALERMALQLDSLHLQVETYEHLGDVQTLSLDLHARYDALAEARRVVITPQEADLSLTCEFQGPVALLWQMVTDPQMLTRTLREGGTWSSISRPGGRSGAGARNHCAHGKGQGMDYLYLDWRPFHYFTARALEGKLTHWEMFLLEPTPDRRGTKFTVRIKLISSLPRPVRRFLCNLVARKLYLEFFESMRQLLAEVDGPVRLESTVETITP